MQFTASGASSRRTFKPGNFGNTPTLGISRKPRRSATRAGSSKIVTLPRPKATTINPANGGNNIGNDGQGHDPARQDQVRPRQCRQQQRQHRQGLEIARQVQQQSDTDATNRHMVNTGAASFQQWMGRGRFSQSFASAGPIRAARSAAAVGGGRSFGGGRLRAAAAILTNELRTNQKTGRAHALPGFRLRRGMIRRPAWRTGPRRHCRRRAR